MGANYNVCAKYEIIGRIKSGATVVAYMINDRTTNKQCKFERPVVEQLALNKQIYNCTAQVYANAVIMKGINCQLNKLPNYNPDGTIIKKEEDIKKKKEPPNLELIGKIQDGRSISDYIVINIADRDSIMKISKEQVIQLAIDDRFINAKAQKNNDQYILRGKNGFNIHRLALYKNA